MTEFKIVHDVQTGEILQVNLMKEEIAELETIRAKALEAQLLLGGNKQ